MAASVKPLIVKERQQHQRRKNAKFRDQFGRVYDVEVDVDTFDPVGPIMLKDARPPVAVPEYYIRPVPGELAQIHVHLEEMRDDLFTAHQEWRRNARALARKHYGDAAQLAIKERTAALLDLVGPEPMPIEFVEAMIAGNKWALGLRTGPNNKGFYPRPRWVTAELLDRLEKSTRTVWATADKAKAPPVDVSKYSDDSDELPAGTAAADDFGDDDEDIPFTKIASAIEPDGLEDLDDEPTDAEREELLREERAAGLEEQAEATGLYPAPETPRTGGRPRGKRNGGTNGE